MTDSANLKVDRAAKHAAELSELFRKERPFVYVLETNAKTRQRSTFAKRNEPVINAAALICGDAIHNLRSALDHAYWDIVSPHVLPMERRSIQFPFCEKAAWLDQAIEQRLAPKAGQSLVGALKRLKPHGEPGGNELLYVIHELDILDKHKLLIPTGDYTRLSYDLIRGQVPDFPRQITDMTFGGNRRDVAWYVQSLPQQLGRSVRAAPDIFEQQLDVPVDIVFHIGPAGSVRRAVVPMLDALIDVTKETVKIIREA